MVNRRAILGSILATALAPRAMVALAQTPVASPEPDLAGAIDALLSDQSVELPFTGAVLITDAGSPILDAAYGFANGTTRELNTTATGFQIASVTKTFTATLIMQLRNEAAFGLDDPASKLIPRFARQLDSGDSPVTIRQLLNHTSGVPDIFEIYDPFDIENYPESLDLMLDEVSQAPLNFDPGDQYRYSNTGYLYLGQIVEAVTGLSWEQVLAERITGPLGLRHTWLTPPDNRGALATGYLPIQGLVLPVSRFGRPDLAEAAGGLTSSTHELLAWLDAFMAGTVVPTATVNEMLEAGDSGYGLGWETLGSGPESWHGHFGQTIGFRSGMYLQPDRNRSIVLLSNRQDYPIEQTFEDIRSLLSDS